MELIPFICFIVSLIIFIFIGRFTLLNEELIRKWQHSRCIYLKRWKYLLGKCLGILLFIAVIAWFVLILIFVDDEKFIKLFEPGVLFIGLFIAYLASKGHFGDILMILERYFNPPLEQYEDPTTKPWRATNHSRHEINDIWIPETNESHLETLSNFLKKGIGKSRLPFGFTLFERLPEETGTINYRVLFPLGLPLFLRIHKSDKYIGDLKTRRKIASHLYKNKKSFNNDDFIKYLIYVISYELRNKKEKYWLNVKNTSFIPYSSVLVEFFPYMDGVAHFNGQCIEELESVAKNLAKLQGHLQLLSENDKKEIDKATKGNRHIKQTLNNKRKLLNANDIKKRWENIEEILDKEKYLINPIVLNIFEEENVRKCLDKAIKEVIALRATSKSMNGDVYPLLLHDVHPHNVVCKDKKCVLIYDYTWTGYWPHSYVLAFSLHRFVREFVICYCEYDTDDNERKNLIKKGRDFFLDNYLQELRDLKEQKPHKLEKLVCSYDFEEDFRKNLDIYIKSANMEKMLNVLNNAVSGKDILQRSEARRIGEVRKFIRYMQEAEEFNNSLLGDKENKK